MAKVELKQPIVDEIKALLDGAVAVTAVDYLGLTVEQDTELRKQLREAGVTYKVFKNTLIKRAAEGTDFAQLDGVLEGPTAIAVSKDDPAAAARIIAKFAEKADKLELKAAVAEGKLYDQNEVKVLQLSLPEKSFEDFADPCRARSRTSHVSSIRWQRRTQSQLLNQQMDIRSRVSVWRNLNSLMVSTAVSTAKHKRIILNCA